MALSDLDLSTLKCGLIWLKKEQILIQNPPVPCHYTNNTTHCTVITLAKYRS